MNQTTPDDPYVSIPPVTQSITPKLFCNLMLCLLQRNFCLLLSNVPAHTDVLLCDPVYLAASLALETVRMGSYPSTPHLSLFTANTNNDVNKHKFLIFHVPPLASSTEVRNWVLPITRTQHM